MAKVTGPLHSSEARGSLGTLTYNTWRGIATVKIRKGPAKEFTDDQKAVRALTKLCTISWKAITDAQRAAWNNYATTHQDCDWQGNPIRLTGYNWYVRINVRRQLVGGAISVTPPTLELAHCIKNLSAHKTFIAIVINWDDQGAYSPATLYYEFYIVGPHSAGASPSVKMADRKSYEDYSVLGKAYIPPSVGLYTIYARPIHSQGVVGGWAKTSFLMT
jgi:hypothetical protein